MEIKNHPSELLQADWIEIIRNHSAEAELNGLLHSRVLHLIYEQEWFKLLAPGDYYGKEKDLPLAVRLLEAFSWADGSLGWVITLCSGAGWFGGFLHPSVAQMVFNDPKVCLAGSGAATGTAMEYKNGFKINGTWKYATGSMHASYFTANCRILDKNGWQKLKKDGSDLIRSFIFKKEEVKIIHTWNAMGMVATGSHSFQINDLNVDTQRSFDINAPVVSRPLFHYPFLQLAEVTLAINLSGMTIHFLDLTERIFDKKQVNEHAILNETRSHFLKIRTSFFQTLDSSWEACAHETGIPENILLKISEASRELVNAARAVLNQLYPYCGLHAAMQNTEINRVWRDFNTAGQHSLLRR